MTIGGGILAIGGGILAVGSGILGRWEWGSTLGSSYDGYLQQEARYVIGRWGWGDQLGSPFDGYLQLFIIIEKKDTP